LPGGDQLFPVGESYLDRREGAAHHDRRRNHDTARRMFVDDEIGSDAEDR
jgi:hypothetical protein